MNNKIDNNIDEFMQVLVKTYPDAKCSLNFSNPFDLLIAVILSAQCTDERVNKTLPSILEVYSTPKEFAEADTTTLEKLIYPCGFYKNKAKNIQACCKILVDKYNSQVPSTMEELISLPGVGRKTANVVMCNAFDNAEGIAVDTHAKRISNRLGLSHENDPLKIEQDLLKIIPKKYLKDVNHLLVYHGREYCVARNPKCTECPLNKFCEYYKTNMN